MPHNEELLTCRAHLVLVEVGWAGYGLDDRGFKSRWGLGFLLFTTVSRQALGPTQHPIQLLSGALSLGVKRQEYEADHSPPSSAEVKECVKLYFHSPIHLHGVVVS
jgi:hypothetical protein